MGEFMADLHAYIISAWKHLLLLLEDRVQFYFIGISLALVIETKIYFFYPSFISSFVLFLIELAAMKSHLMFSGISEELEEAAFPQAHVLRRPLCM